MKNISALFAEGLQKLQLALDSADQQKLLDFLALLQKWNAHYNLTSITEPAKMISHHLLDSLAIAPFVPQSATQILDVGSGAGFPGIPLAIYFPQKHWTLLDSNGKKTRFLTQAKLELNLQNVTIVQTRMEDWRPEQKFEVIVARAVGAIKSMVSQTNHLLSPSGKWLFMKSDYQQEDLENLNLPADIHPLSVPGVTAKRHLIIISQNEAILAIRQDL